MKQYQMIIAVLLLAGLLAGCGAAGAGISGSTTAVNEEPTAPTQKVPENTEVSNPEEASADTSDATPGQAETSAESEAETGKSLILYFDYSENMGDTAGMTLDRLPVDRIETAFKPLTGESKRGRAKTFVLTRPQGLWGKIFNCSPPVSKIRRESTSPALPYLHGHQRFGYCAERLYDAGNHAGAVDILCRGSCASFGCISGRLIVK